MNRLPAEIIHSIVQHASLKDLCNFALVCKSWMIPTQSVLYTNVTIYSEPQFLLFYNTVKHDSQLGNKVNIFDIQFGVLDYRGVLEEIFDLYSNLLPNVEVLHEQDSCTYVPTLKALSNSNLKYLRRLQPITSGIYGDELKNYVDCVYLMKDRLENISINEKLITTKPGLKDFYNELLQFEKLQEVEIELESYNIIKVLEHVTEECRILKNISFRFYGSSGYVQTNDVISNAEMLSYTPYRSVKSLLGYMVGYTDTKLLPYIIHKFPRLDHLDLDYAIPTYISLDISLFKRLLNFISGIDKVSLSGLSLDRNDATNFIENFWDAFENTKIGDCYISFGTKIAFGIIKKGCEHATAIDLTYTENGLNPDWQFYMEFIERGGKFIHDLGFYFSQVYSGNSKMYELPSTFIPQTLKQCVHLQKLHLQQCILKQMNYEDNDFTTMVTLSEFSLGNCVIYDGIFKKMSECLTEVTQLKPDAAQYLSGVDEQSVGSINSVYEINMPNTKINTVIFEGVYGVHSFYVKVLALANENQCKYYRFDVLGFGRSSKFESTEVEYDTLNNDKHIYICCQTNPIIEFK